MDNVTEKVALAINNAVNIAKENHSPDVDVPHLLKALLDDNDSLFKNICLKENINIKQVSDIVDDFIKNKVQSNSNNLHQQILTIYLTMLANIKKNIMILILVLSIYSYHFLIINTPLLIH